MKKPVLARNKPAHKYLMPNIIWYDWMQAFFVYLKHIQGKGYGNGYIEIEICTQVYLAPLYFYGCKADIQTMVTVGRLWREVTPEWLQEIIITLPWSTS